MSLRGRFTDRLRLTPLLIAVCLAISVARPAAAQPLSDEVYKTGDRLLAAFRPVAADTRKSTVRVLIDDEPAALGIVVSEDGYILTKSTQLRGPITVRLTNGREEKAETVAVDGPSDLALLKIAAKGLTPAEWADKEPKVGSWLVSVGETKSPVGVGVLSVSSRKIPSQRGVLGIHLASSLDPRVEEIVPSSAAAEAGLQVGDVIMAVAGKSVPTREDLLERLKQFSPGETLPIVIRRGEKEEQVKATLGNEISLGQDRQTRQNVMGGPVSVRSGGFDLAVQHDTVLRPEDCGGPVVDLSGRVVGMNIARAGRVESYALPTSAVRPILAKLMGSESRTVKK